MKFHANRDLYNWRDGVSITLFEPLADGSAEVAKPIEYERVTTGYVVQPSLRLDMAEAQTLIDQLWDCGLRPSEGSGSAGALAATQRHLEDMRQLVFKVAETEKP